MPKGRSAITSNGSRRTGLRRSLQQCGGRIWSVVQMALGPWPRPRGRRVVWCRDPVQPREEQ